MQIEPLIRFRGMDRSPAVEDRVKARVDRLGQFHPRLTSCTVVIEAPHRHGHKGQIYHVAVDVTMPGGELVVNREPEANHAHEDVYVAIRDAFNAMERRIEDTVRKMDTHRVKPHPEKLHGKIDRLERLEGYGFIRTADMADVYFDKDSMSVDVWDKIAVGDEVRFTEREGDKGAYATAVAPAGSESG